MPQYVIGRNNVPLIFGGNLLGYSIPELAPGIFRFEFSDTNVDPNDSINIAWGYWTKVDGVSTNQWDLVYSGVSIESLFYSPYSGGKLIPENMNNGTCRLIKAGDISGFWSSETEGVKINSLQHMFHGCTALTEVIPVFNLVNTPDVESMFYGCTSLRRVPDFDNFSSVKYMEKFCRNCTSLEYVPLLDTENIIKISGAFSNCTNVISGALALYTQASTQSTPPTNHAGTFYNCGINTITGADELSQIPSSWKQSY